MVGGVSGVEADVIPFGSVIGNRARLAGAERHRAAAARRGPRGGAYACARRCATCSRAAACSRIGWPAVRATHGDDALVAEVLAFIDAPSKRGLIRAAWGADESA